MKDNVSGLRVHCSPPQAPSLEYQCSSGGNSSRSAIRGKKTTHTHTHNSILLQKDRMPMQTCAGPHMDTHSFKHRHEVCSVQMTHPVVSFIKASDLKSTHCWRHLCLLRKICSKAKTRSRVFLHISEVED